VLCAVRSRCIAKQTNAQKFWPWYEINATQNVNQGIVISGLLNLISSDWQEMSKLFEVVDDPPEIESITDEVTHADQHKHEKMFRFSTLQAFFEPRLTHTTGAALGMAGQNAG
jgi:hypothetical protein